MILFATNDAGPALYLKQIIDALGESFICVSSPVSAKIFEGYESKNKTVTYNEQARYDEYLEKEFFNQHIDLIVVGTSWGCCIDKAAIKFATTHHIKSIAVIEHWSWYLERFKREDHWQLPDYILVNDQIALSQAIASGLPKDKILPLGNPVLEKCALESMPLADRAAWCTGMGFENKKSVVFISENYRGDFLPGTARYQGFDEFDVLEDLLSSMSKEHHLMVKLHPQENEIKYAKYKGNCLSVLSQTDIPALTVNADFIIGMGSMLLLEMAAHRKDIISYRPHELKSFIGNEIGATCLVKDKKILKEILDERRVVNNEGLQNRFAGSRSRIVEFIKGNLK